MAVVRFGAVKNQLPNTADFAWIFRSGEFPQGEVLMSEMHFNRRRKSLDDFSQRLDFQQQNSWLPDLDSNQGPAD
jgi:hypothetical protein